MASSAVPCDPRPQPRGHQSRHCWVTCRRVMVKVAPHHAIHRRRSILTPYGAQLSAGSVRVGRAIGLLAIHKSDGPLACATTKPSVTGRDHITIKSNAPSSSANRTLSCEEKNHVNLSLSSRSRPWPAPSPPEPPHSDPECSAPAGGLCAARRADDLAVQAQRSAPCH